MSNKDERRAAMPTVAAIVDEFREWLDHGGRLIYASENGHVLDRRTEEDPDKAFQIPKDYYPCRQINLKSSPKKPSSS